MISFCVLRSMLFLTVAGLWQSGAASSAAIRIPYSLTDTKHIVIRARVNGNGPFNFIMDTGAPSLFLPPNLARTCGVTVLTDGWGLVKKLEIEGGVEVTDLRSRVEEPMQISRMNSLGMAGRHLDGIIGYNVIARFRVEIDMRRPYMEWTPANAIPPDPPNLRQLTGGKAIIVPKTAKEMYDLAQMASALLPKKQDIKAEPRGFLGMELSDWSGDVRVLRVLAGSPADKAGVRTGDLLVTMGIAGESPQPVRNSAQALRLVERLAQDTALTLKLRRGGMVVEVSARAAGGSI